VCFQRSRYRDESTQEQAQGERLWDLFYRETWRHEPPVLIAEEDEPLANERDGDEVATPVKR
jgi:hypothetical protein